jgi:phosphonate transport system substrate-binding protein
MKRFLTTAAAALLAATLFTGNAQGEIPDKLVLGMVPSREADVIIDSLAPLAELLSQALLVPVEPFISTSYPAMVEAVGTGRVDIAFFGSAALVQAMDMHGAEVILGSVRRGSTTYLSQFTIRCDSGITEFEQLRGATISFVEPGSTSGYQFPYVFLKNVHGIDPDADMTSFFAGSHDASVLAVYNGDVDVAVSFNDARTAIQSDFPDVMDVLCVLGYTDPIPNDGAVVRAGLDPELVEQITQALIDIANTEEGRVLTEAMFNVTEFARIDAEVYDVVRQVSATFNR